MGDDGAPAVDEPAPRAARGLTRAVSTGMAWSAGAAFGRRAISTVVFVVLARLLVPEDFGIVALAAVFVAILGLVRDQGLIQAVVQRRSVEALHLDTAFMISVGVGALLAAAVAGLSPLIGRALDEPDLVPILFGLAPAVFLGGLRSVPAALLLRALQLRSIAVRQLVGIAAGGIVGVSAALAGWGAWALVAQTLTDSAVGALLLWLQVDWRPRLRFSRRHFRDLFGFSVNIFASQVLVQAFRRGDDLLIGAVLGPVALGLYSVAYRLMTLANELFVQSLSKVMFPAFSQMQDDPVRLRRAMTKAVRLTSVLAVPAFVGMAVVAPEVVVVVFGDEWRDAGPIAAMLAVGAIPQPLWTMQIQLLNGTGHAGVALRAHLANAVISIAGFAIAVPHGIDSVAAVFAARGFLVLPVAGWFTRRSTGIGLGRLVRASVPAVVAGSMMAIVGLGARSGLSETSALIVVAGAGLAACATYVTVVAVGYPSVRRELRVSLSSVRSGRRHTAAANSMDD